MRNYAEELAYWYFRFNGFFLLNNYVSHPGDRGDNSHSDSDLLGVRMPYSREVVGLNTNEDICGQLSANLIDEKNPNLIIGLICEVKGGENPFVIGTANLLSQIRRLGFFTDEEKINEVVERLTNNPSIEEDNFKIIKVIVCRGDNGVDIPESWIRINLEHILNYISNERFKRYHVKFGGWDKFDSPVIQFLLRHRDSVQIKTPDR